MLHYKRENFWLVLLVRFGSRGGKSRGPGHFPLLGKLVNFSICLCRVSTFLLRNATRDLQESYELERNIGISSRSAHFRESKGFNSKVSNKSPFLASHSDIVIFHYVNFPFCMKEALDWREGWFLVCHHP